MVGLISPDDPAAAYATYLPQLRREYSFWMEGAQGVMPGKPHRRVVAMPDGSRPQSLLGRQRHAAG